MADGVCACYDTIDIVDIKPKNMEELTEVITAADFHPSHCNIMMYSTSRGAIKLGDMRQAALCDSYCKGARAWASTLRRRHTVQDPTRN